MGDDRRPWRLGGLGRRLLAAVLALILVPLAVLLVVFAWQSTARTEALVAENVATTARSYATDVDLFLQRQRTLLERVPLAGERVDDALDGLVASDPNLEALMLLDADGTFLAASPPVPDAWALEACEAQRAAASAVMIHAAEGHAHEVVVALPRQEGLLCGQVSFTLHQDMLSTRADSVVRGTAYIVDRSGTVVCHAFGEDEPHVDRGGILVGPATEAAADGVEWAGRIDSGSHGPAFAAYAPAESLPWGVWVEVPVDVATAPLWAWLGPVLALAVLVAAGFSAIALVMVRRFVAPVHDVVEAARRIAEGRPGETVPERGDDEIAELAAEFNKMSTALAASVAELDGRVASRTQELERAREFSDRLLNTLGDRILVIDRDLTVVRANDAAIAAYGEQVVGCGCQSVHRSIDGPDRCPAQRVLETGEPTSEERVRTVGGRTEVLAVDAYPFLGDDGLPGGVVEIARDVTELKGIHATLVHQEKMATVGTLAAGLAHEIGNPLASMSSELEMLERHWDADEARASVPVLREQVQRISRLLRELVDFGRPAADEAAPVPPDELLDEVVRLLRHDPRARSVDIAVEVEPGFDAVCAARDRLVQVLVNLGINALDAVDERGRVVFFARRDGDRAVLGVSDDGDGLPAGAEHQIFDPFFTTKSPGRGTGLGLFVSERIVASLGGRLEARAGDPRGTVMSMVLPACGCGAAGGEP